MTAIAYRGGILAADTQELSGRLRAGYAVKIVRRADGALAGASGRADLDYQFLELFKTGHCDEFRPQGKEAEDFSGLVIEPDGVVWNYTELGKHPTGIAPWHTLGSAHAFLHGAMAAGASAEEAVRLAIKHCADCGGVVTVLRLGCTLDAERDNRIDPGDWPIHERLIAAIKTDEPITLDIMNTGKRERTTSWGNNLHLHTRKDDTGIEVPSLIGQTWGTNGVEETEQVIAEGNPKNLLTLRIWRPGVTIRGGRLSS